MNRFRVKTIPVFHPFILIIKDFFASRFETRKLFKANILYN